jgi:hypothetical protein
MSIDEARRLSNSPDLLPLLRARLVQLAMSDNGSVSVRAIEMILGFPSAASGDDVLDRLPLALVMEAQERAEKWIAQLEQQ